MKFSSNKKLWTKPPSQPKTDVVSYFSFKSIMRDGIGAILVPCQDWSERRIKAEIFQRIKDFDPIEGISFCSFDAVMSSELVLVSV